VLSVSDVSQAYCVEYWQPRLLVGAFHFDEEPCFEAMILSPSPPPLPRNWNPPWGPLGVVRPYDGPERRLIPRHQILMVGKITLTKGLSVDCAVRNFSPAGAALWLKTAANLPMKFDLHFDNATRHCIVVWRRPYWMGVRFKAVP
jgi:hypothetical protein